MRTQLIGNGLLSGRISRHHAAVLAALQCQGATADELLCLDDGGWREVLALCDRLQLTLPLALRPSKGFPVWVSERLAGNLRDTAERFARVQDTYREAATVLDRAGVPHLVLKGFTQAPDFVKAPQYRMQGDIDFYTPPGKTEAAFDALQASGYEPAGPPEDYRTADHPPTLVRFGQWKWRGDYFDPEMPLALEVHTCLWNPRVSLIAVPEVEGFWNRRVSRTLGTLSFASLDPIDHLCYFALHLLRDIFPGQRVIHHALELATFLHEHADDSAFWREWEARYSPRLKQMQVVALTLAGATFSSRRPESIEEQIREMPADLKTWIERCAGDLIAETFRRTRNGRLLQLLLSDSRHARRKILWRAISPGTIAGLKKAGISLQHPTEPQLQRWGVWRYLASVAGRISLNGAAVLRFIGSGVGLFLSQLARRRDPVG